MTIEYALIAMKQDVRTSSTVYAIRPQEAFLMSHSLAYPDDGIVSQYKYVGGKRTERATC